MDLVLEPPQLHPYAGIGQPAGIGLALGTAIGVVAVLLALGLAVAAWRLRPPHAHVRLERGQVDVVAGRSQHRFDLTAAATEVEMDGTPGERDWRLRFVRRGLEPVTVDARMVDGLALTEAVRVWRPEL